MHNRYIDKRRWENNSKNVQKYGNPFETRQGGSLNGRGGGLIRGCTDRGRTGSLKPLQPRPGIMMQV
ncbi:hypothetical protein CBFG_05957 [Clostridiales bacterium 1_7_47FAA]|nr:hypothetical protein CBFG_05957 [Clostridiales bacterium 1_7_47FAA]